MYLETPASFPRYHNSQDEREGRARNTGGAQPLGWLHEYEAGYSDYAEDFANVATALGVSLHEIITHLKAQPTVYPTLELIYNPRNPIDENVIINLPKNGIRLRFDGPDQRLRLIEILDFSKMKFTYKDTEVVKPTDAQPSMGVPGASPTGPRFRHVYDKLLGPTFAGEYNPPRSDDPNASGSYILSYPGVSFSFPMKHSAYSPKKDFISLLSSSATSPATSMAIFYGDSWPAVRSSLFTAVLPNPRSLALAIKGREEGPDEVDLARVLGDGRIELIRRSSPPYMIVLGETTPQDLIAELGAPDSIYRKSDHRLLIHKERTGSGTSERPVGMMADARQDSFNSTDSETLNTEDDDDDEDSDQEDGGTQSSKKGELVSSESFFNYFSHGFDILISQPTRKSPGAPNSDHNKKTTENDNNSIPANHLTVNKIIFHSNVPGSYQFNRHRRSRWTLEHVEEPFAEPLNSETAYETISRRLKNAFQGSYGGQDEEIAQQRGMAINRGWGDSPGSSCELLGEWDESSGVRKRFANSSIGEESESRPSLGNTMLFGFPGTIFEVMENQAICCLTVY